MNFIAFFFASVISTVLSAYLARWGASHFVSKESTSIAAFSFILGGGSFVTINFGAGASEDLKNTALALGTAVGVSIIWFLFFKREMPNG